jgi:hypothetical protein
VRGTSHGFKNEESRMGSIFAGRYLQNSPYGRVAIAVQRMPLNKRLECPSCMRMKVKTAVRSAPERNWATPRLDSTDLYSPARDDAERITATDTMMNISKLHAGTRYGIENKGYYYKMWVSMEMKSKDLVHGLLGWISRALQIFKVSRVPGQRVLILVRVSQDSARVGKCVVK